MQANLCLYCSQTTLPELIKRPIRLELVQHGLRSWEGAQLVHRSSYRGSGSGMISRSPLETSHRKGYCLVGGLGTIAVSVWGRDNSPKCCLVSRHVVWVRGKRFMWLMNIVNRSVGPGTFGVHKYPRCIQARLLPIPWWARATVRCDLLSPPKLKPGK